MDESSGILVIIVVLVLLCVLWKPAGQALAAASGCPSGCRCPDCSGRHAGFLGGGSDAKVEGASGGYGENKGVSAADAKSASSSLSEDKDTSAEASMKDPSEFYESEDQILSGAESGYNHQDVIPAMALESDVQSSHDAYVSELRGRTTTASKSTVMDHYTPVNKFHGLSMRRGFRQMGPSEGSRVVPSETSKQILEMNSFSHAPFCL